MAITRNLLTASGSGTNGTSFATASITPGGNRLVLAALYYRTSSGAPTPSISGNGITWVEVQSTPNSGQTSGFWVWRGMVASPSTEAITFSGITNGTSASWIIVEFDGVDTSGTNGSGAIVQSAETAVTGTSNTVTLAAFGSADNWSVGFCGMRQGSGVAMNSDGTFTEFANPDNGGEAGQMSGIEYAGDRDPTWSWTGSASSASCGIEVKAATAASGSHPGFVSARGGWF